MAPHVRSFAWYGSCVSLIFPESFEQFIAGSHAWQELGAAGLTKRPTSCMLVMPKPVKGAAEADEEFDTLYETVFTKVKSVQPAF